MYHSVCKEKHAYKYSTLESAFEQQVQFLKENYYVISIDEAYEILYGDSLPAKDRPMVVLTFDDGFQDNYSVVYPILKRYRLPFAIFVTTDFISEDNATFMTWDEIAKLSIQNEVTIGSHSKNHVNLRALKLNDKKRQIQYSKIFIESRIKKKVDYFSYPGGGIDYESLNLVELNYKLAVVDRPTRDKFSKVKIPRVSIDKSHDDNKKFIVELLYGVYLDV